MKKRFDNKKLYDLYFSGFEKTGDIIQL